TWSMFAPGPGAFSVGWFKGNPGHTAATVNGVNIEARGGRGVVMGSAARGARNSLFTNLAHVKGFARGGKATGGDLPFDLLNPHGQGYLGNNVLRQLGIKTFDGGGRWHTGTLGYNGSGQTETVRTPRQEAALHPTTIYATFVDANGIMVGTMRGVVAEEHSKAARDYGLN